jgi:hypothetical protein
LTKNVKVGRNIKAVKDLESISMINNERMTVCRMAAGVSKRWPVEHVFLECETESDEEYWKGPWMNFHARADLEEAPRTLRPLKPIADCTRVLAPKAGS